MSRPEWAWLDNVLRPEPFEHDAVQLAADLSVDDDDWALRHVEG